LVDFDYLTVVTAADYMEYFEMVYRMVSLKQNHSLILKTRLYSRDNPTVASVTPLWRAAYYQEREIFDLFGIKFEGILISDASYSGKGSMVTRCGGTISNAYKN